MKRFAFLSMLILIICVLFAGCSKSSPLVGTWEKDNTFMTFKRDGSGNLKSEGRYSSYWGSVVGVFDYNLIWEASEGTDGTLIIRTERDEIITGDFEVVGSTLFLSRINDSAFYGMWDKQ